jgi:hypothetical protein
MMSAKIVPCGYCGATGKVGSGYADRGKTTCPVCLGRQKISVDAGATKCSGCKGTGRTHTGYFTLGLQKHNDCHGTGWLAPRVISAALIR